LGQREHGNPLSTTHANVGFAKLYLEKTGLAAVDFLNDKVLPFYDAQGIQVHRVLTDSGVEYCGRQETHPYELFLTSMTSNTPEPRSGDHTPMGQWND